MKNKTCGECRKFGNKRSVICHLLKADHEACASFEPPPTNGDRVRQKSNEEFARDYVHYHSKFKVYVARLCPLNKQLWTTREEAQKANLDWLNAPADCVKQTPGNETQTDLRKADDTESEGKNETE